MKKLMIAFAVLVVVGILFGGVAYWMGRGEESWEAETEESSFSDVSGITVSVGSADVRVVPSDESEVTAVCTGTRSIRFAVSCENGQMRVTEESAPWYKQISDWFTLWGSPAASVEIRVPEDFGGELDIRSASGEVEVRGSAARATIRTSSGSISLSDMQIEGDLVCEASSGRAEVLRSAFRAGNLTTASGSIRAEEIECEELTLESASGSAKSCDVRCDRFAARTSSGSVSADRLDAGAITMKSASGSVSGTAVDEIGNYDVTVHTSSGSSNLATGRYGDEKTLEITTSSGSIDFTFLGE